MFEAGMRHFRSNMLRAARETIHLARDRVDYERLATSGLAMLSVMGYAEDRLFPHRVLKRAMKRAAIHGVNYATPICLRAGDDGSCRVGKWATHNDEQFNPTRVGGAVAELLRS